MSGLLYPNDGFDVIVDAVVRLNLQPNEPFQLTVFNTNTNESVTHTLHNLNPQALYDYRWYFSFGETPKPLLWENEYGWQFVLGTRQNPQAFGDVFVMGSGNCIPESLKTPEVEIKKFTNKDHRGKVRKQNVLIDQIRKEVGCSFDSLEQYSKFGTIRLFHILDTKTPFKVIPYSGKIRSQNINIMIYPQDDHFHAEPHDMKPFELVEIPLSAKLVELIVDFIGPLYKQKHKYESKGRFIRALVGKTLISSQIPSIHTEFLDTTELTPLKKDHPMFDYHKQKGSCVLGTVKYMDYETYDVKSEDFPKFYYNYEKHEFYEGTPIDYSLPFISKHSHLDIPFGWHFVKDIELTERMKQDPIILQNFMEQQCYPYTFLKTMAKRGAKFNIFMSIRSKHRTTGVLTPYLQSKEYAPIVGTLTNVRADENYGTEFNLNYTNLLATYIADNFYSYRTFTIRKERTEIMRHHSSFIILTCVSMMIDRILDFPPDVICAVRVDQIDYLKSFTPPKSVLVEKETTKCRESYQYCSTFQVHPPKGYKEPSLPIVVHGCAGNGKTTYAISQCNPSTTIMMVFSILRQEKERQSKRVKWVFCSQGFPKSYKEWLGTGNTTSKHRRYFPFVKQITHMIHDQVIMNSNDYIKLVLEVFPHMQHIFIKETGQAELWESEEHDLIDWGFKHVVHQLPVHHWRQDKDPWFCEYLNTVFYPHVAECKELEGCSHSFAEILERISDISTSEIQPDSLVIARTKEKKKHFEDMGIAFATIHAIEGDDNSRSFYILLNPYTWKCKMLYTALTRAGYLWQIRKI